MLIPNKFNGYTADGRRLMFLDMGGDAPPPPDYTPLANASAAAAQVSEKLGQEQLTEARRQYDNTMAVSQPVVDAQLQVMRQGLNQGNDYYNYSTQFRPLEQAMLANVTGMSAGDVDKVNAMRGQSLNAARSSWQQQQDARAAELQQQIAAAQAQEEQALQQQIENNYAQQQEQKRKAEEETKFAIAENKFKSNLPNADADLNWFDSEKTSLDGSDEYLKQKIERRQNLLDAKKEADSKENSPQVSKSSQLQSELDKLRQQQFDDSGVDYSGADQESQRLMMAGMQAKTQAEQADIDRITAETRANAGQLRTRTQAYEQDAARDIALATGGNQGIYDKFRSDIDSDVGTALADTRTGQTSALNTALRQAMRYGLSVPTNAQALSNQNATQLAAAANNTRTGAINNYRGVVAQGIGLKQGAFTTGQASTMDAMAKQEGASQQGRNMRIQNESLNWAKQLDVTGMARGMPGASQGAYGVAVGAGNSATQNQMAPGQALVGAMGQASNTTMQGRQIAMQGLSGVLNSQTSASNAAMNSDNGAMGALGTVAGAAITVF